MKRNIEVSMVLFACIAAMQLGGCAASKEPDINDLRAAINAEKTRPGVTNISVDQIQVRAGKIDKNAKIVKYKNQAEYEKALYQFRHRIIVDSYTKYGIHDPKWDNKAIAFLEEFTKSKYRKDSKINENEVARVGKALIDMGCNDPMVISRYAIVSRSPESKTYFTQAMKGFENSKYPKGCVRDLPFYMFNLDNTAGLSYPKRTEKWRAEVIRLTAEALDDGSYLPGEQRFVMDTFLPEESTLFGGIDDELPNTEWVTVFEAIKDRKNVDPYLYNVIGAHYLKYSNTHVQTITADPQNWRIAGNLQAEMKAREMLIAAWKMHPENPIAPAYMVRVTLDLLMAGKQTEDPRVWFDRARAAQYDYNPAYYLYTAYLGPDWGNSLDSLYDLGAECVKDGRYDTGIPLYMLKALWRFSDCGHAYGLSNQEIMAYWESPKTGRLLNMMYDGYAKSQYQHDSAHWKSSKAAVAWFCKRYKDAKMTLDEMGDKANKIVFLTDNNTPYNIVEEDSNFFISPYANELKRAKSIRDTDKAPEALRIYNSVYGKVRNDQHMRKLLKNRIDIMRLKMEFHDGKWHNIMPSREFTEWSAFAGDWKINPQGYLECTPPEWWGAALFTYLDFGNRFEVRSKLSFDDKTTVFGILVNAPSIKPDWTADYTAVLMGKEGNRLEVTKQGLANSYIDIGDLKLTQPSELLIQRWDNVISIYVNGQPVKKDIQLIAGPVDKPSCIGLGGSSYDKGAMIQYQSLEIRYLKEKPAAP